MHDIKHFDYTEQVEINNEHRYFILCANINSNDSWVWKWNQREYNFTPAFSNEYGDSSILGKDLEKCMKDASEWIDHIAIGHSKEIKEGKRPRPALYLLNVDSLIYISPLGGEDKTFEKGGSPKD